MEKPQVEHWMAVKRIVQCLHGSKLHGICSKLGGKVDSYGYSDADWSGNHVNRNEAEYIALSLAIQEGKWVQRLLRDNFLATAADKSELKVTEDNQSCIKMTKDSVIHGKAKSIKIKYHYILNEVKCEKVKLESCETTNILADIMTKGPLGPRHKDMTAALGIHTYLH
uniref:Polyprotein n=1 Tax=Peronospora matthiolae TaxID=2874970 RepID=A0AAV1UEP4_9STRA